MTPELSIRTAEGTERTVRLDGVRYSLGRSTENHLCYAEDTGLSRQHLAFERDGEDWCVLDLGSKNGTLVNGVRISGSRRLMPGDRVSAGRLIITYAGPSRPATGTVMFVDSPKSTEEVAATAAGDLGRLAGAGDSRHMEALVNAGRELAGHRPLNDLFPLILNLSLDAVKADRGVLLTIEGDGLLVRAARGDAFTISTAVRDRVIRNKESLLVWDVMSDDALSARQSIVSQGVRSMMAVPLRAGDCVIGLIYVDSPNFVRGFGPKDLDLLTVMANVAAVRIEHARLAEVEQAERLLGRELEQAAEIQERLLPAAPPVVPGFELAGYNLPCRTVGGDYYDFFPYPDGKLGLVVADVAGKGMPAALLMSSLQARVQVLSEEAADLARWMGRLNRLMATSCPSSRFITLFFAVLDPATGAVDYSNAGHNPPLVVRSGGEVELLDVGGMVLGLMPAAPYQAGSCQVKPGDMLVLYSDGVTEAVSPDGEEFGEERLTRLAVDNRRSPAARIAQEIRAALAAWTGGRPPTDDVTLVVAKRI